MPLLPDLIHCSQQPTGPDGYNTWIITDRGGSSFWGVAWAAGHDLTTADVLHWHGPFDSVGAALLNLHAARTSGLWPGLYVEKPATK
jgi:hypothetical protein